MQKVACARPQAKRLAAMLTSIGIFAVLARPASALEASGSILTRSAYGLVLEEELFTETIATAEVFHRFSEAPELTFKLRVDPAFQYDDGTTSFQTYGRYGIDEAYLRYTTPRWDFSAGIQKMAWGRGDGIVPNDFINPQDLTRFLLDSELERKIGNLLVRGMYSGKSGTVEVVWIPKFRPDVLPPPGDPFFPPTLLVDPSVELLGFPVPAEISLLDENLPDTGLKHSELAIRMAGTFGTVDSQLYLFWGYQRRPVYAPEAHFFLNALPADLSLIDLLDADLRIDVTPTHPPIWQIGMDFTASWGPIVLRGEAAFVQGSQFNWADADDLPQQQLAGVIQGPQTRYVFHDSLLEIITPPLISENDSALLLLGVDWPAPNLGTWELFLSGQLIQQRILDVTVPLLFDERETSVTGVVRASQGGDRITLEVRGDVNLSREGYLMEGAASYKFADDWKVRGRVSTIGGEPGSFLGDYQYLDVASLELVRYW